MRRILSLVLLLAACSGGGTAFLDTWKDDGFERVTVEGQPGLIDAKERVLYIESCDIARRVSLEGGDYGPSPRRADLSFTPGYATICKS